MSGRKEGGSITAIVLTFNEEKHIGRCLESLRDAVDRIVVVDCFSTDETRSIAARLGAEVVTHAWVNHSAQLNWALDTISVSTDWILRIDADEVLLTQYATVLPSLLARLPKTVSGVSIKRRIHFLGQWIRYGGIYPNRTLRIWRTGRGRYESRWMDEHMMVNGDIAHLDVDVADINLNGVTWWVDKHNRYASREVIDILTRSGKCGSKNEVMDGRSRRIRWLKETLYLRIPRGLRAFLYFSYRYFIRFGFLDGWRGFAFHALQAFWYRLLVDIKLDEIETVMKGSGLTLAEAARDGLAIDLKAPE